jgi:deoxyribose-phosphate aldolase
MKVNQFLDATYLKTASQATISEEENEQKIIDLVNESTVYNYKLIMIRANHIPLAKKMLSKGNSPVLIGTVIDFPEGNSSIENKLKEAKKAIELHADELDFVINYNAFKAGNLSLIKEEVLECTKLCIANNKVVKFIIEVAALSSKGIIVISQLIKEVILNNFDDGCNEIIFVFDFLYIYYI